MNRFKRDILSYNKGAFKAFFSSNIKKVCILIFFFYLSNKR